jgi:hypothetical protein
VRDPWSHHDVSIIELDGSSGHFPKEYLKLPRNTPKIDQGPVSTLGHPHGTPLKYTGSGLQARLTVALPVGAIRTSSYVILTIKTQHI